VVCSFKVTTLLLCSTQQTVRFAEFLNSNTKHQAIYILKDALDRVGAAGNRLNMLMEDSPHQHTGIVRPIGYLGLAGL
jgi:hypothetical protein